MPKLELVQGGRNRSRVTTSVLVFIEKTSTTFTIFQHLKEYKGRVALRRCNVKDDDGYCAVLTK